MSAFSPPITTPTYTASPFPDLQHKNNQQTSSTRKKNSRKHLKKKYFAVLNDAKKFHKALYYKKVELKLAKKNLTELLDENSKLKEENLKMKEV